MSWRGKSQSSVMVQRTLKNHLISSGGIWHEFVDSEELPVATSTMTLRYITLMASANACALLDSFIFELVFRILK